MTIVLLRTAIVVAGVAAGGLVGLFLRHRRAATAPLHPLLAGGRLVVVTAPFCGRCRVLLDRIALLAPDVPLEVRDVRDDPGFAAALEIRTAPTLLVTDEAGNVVDRSDGVPSDDRLHDLLTAARGLERPK